MTLSVPIGTARRSLGLKDGPKCLDGALLRRFEYEGWNDGVLALPSRRGGDRLTIGVFEPDSTPASSRLPNGLRVHRAYVIEAAAVVGEAQHLLDQLITAATHEFRDNARTH